MHIANHLAGLAGTAAHIAFMDAARSVYRILLLEAALLSFIVWLQAVSGACLAFFLIIHVDAVLSGRWASNLDTNLYFAAAGFHVPPFQLFFAPYYFLAV